MNANLKKELNRYGKIVSIYNDGCTHIILGNKTKAANYLYGNLGIVDGEPVKGLSRLLFRLVNMNKPVTIMHLNNKDIWVIPNANIKDTWLHFIELKDGTAIDSDQSILIGEKAYKLFKHKYDNKIIDRYGCLTDIGRKMKTPVKTKGEVLEIFTQLESAYSKLIETDSRWYNLIYDIIKDVEFHSGKVGKIYMDMMKNGKIIERIYLYKEGLVELSLKNVIEQVNQVISSIQINQTKYVYHVSKRR